MEDYKVDRKKLEKFIEMMLPVLISLIVFILFSFEKNENNNYIYYVLSFLSLFWISIDLSFILFKNIGKNRKEDKNIQLLEEWIEYKKKRSEIEEKIESLTQQLINSDVSEYLDINRLVFDGQDKIGNKKAVDYDLFLKQNGLSIKEIEIKKDRAVFLTPFNNNGVHLFDICKDTLDKMGIYLTMTDNNVEKSDILSNIILLIIKSEFVIVNINGRNPNVYYELGIAHTLGKQTIIISNANNLIEDIGFDIRQKRIIMYKSDDELIEQLLYIISNIKYHETT